MVQRYAIAAFRSRSQLMRFEKLLKDSNIKAEVIATPQRVKLGCGLSVKLDLADLDSAKDVYMRNSMQSLDGFYIIDEENGRVRVLGGRIM